MTATSVAGSNFPLDVNTGTTGTPVWTAVKGIVTLSFNETKTQQDDNSFENAGWLAKMTTARGVTVNCQGHAKYDDAGVKDAGQLAVEAYGAETGAAARGDFRIVLPGGETAKRFTADVSVTQFGGSVNDLATWGCELVLAAAATTEAVA